MKGNNILSLDDISSFRKFERKAVLQKVKLTSSKSVEVYLKREDLIHETISGNKWRKLKYNLLNAKKDGYNTLLTFGGAYSNHIHAAAYAGKLFGFNTIGIIRGEEHLPLNPTLADAVNFGMKIQYLNRKSYRNKTDTNLIKKLTDVYGRFYLLPEGGSNNLAVKGCTEIVNDINIDYDFVAAACGTGGTLSGIISGLNGNKNIIGVPVLKGADFLRNDINNYVYNFSNKHYTNWDLKLVYHFGGYAKVNKELIQFIKEFESLNNVSLDPIYTGKLLYAINDMIMKGEFPVDSKVIAIHSGGLQGIRGMQNKINKLLF